MKVYCYHHNPNDKVYQFPAELIDLWWGSWSKYGFEAKMLTEKDAYAHPRFKEIFELAGRLPTVNARTYEVACWVRWLANELVAPAVFTDFDVMNFGLRPEQVPTNGDMVSLSTWANPGCVYATPKGISDFIDRFKDAEQYSQEINGQKHTSDLCLFEKLYPHPEQSFCIALRDSDKESAPLIHFPNVDVPLNQKFHNRYLAVREYMKKHGIE